jgi:hypothetical protein
MVISSKQQFARRHSALVNVEEKLRLRHAREEMIRKKNKAFKESLRKQIPKEEREREKSEARSKSIIEQVEALFGEDNGVVHEAFGFETMKSLNQVTSQVTGILSMLEEKMESILDIFKKATSAILWKVPLLILLWCVADRFGLGLGCIGILAPNLIKHFSGFWESYITAGATLESGIDGICATIATLLVSCVYPKGAQPSTYADLILRRVATFQRSQEGFKGLFSGLLGWFETLLNYTSKYFGGPEFVLADRTYSTLKVWMAKVDAFDTICTLRHPSVKELKEAVDLSVEGIGFRRIAGTPTTISLVSKYQEKLGLLLQARRGALNAADAFRALPVMVLLGGGSGVGKTVLQQYIAVSALIKSGHIKDGDQGIENLWQRGLSEYWNGYVQQKCLIFDDIFQVKNPDTMSDSEFMQIIRLIGNWACPLNYADVESKGRFYFNSPLVMGSTNLQDVSAAAKELVVFPEAVVRRIQFGYWLEVESAYISPTGGFNYDLWQDTFKNNLRNKQPDTPYLECIPWEAWRLYPHSFDQSFQKRSHDAPFINIKDLIEQVAESLIRRRDTHVEATGLSTDFFRGLANDMAKAKEKQESELSEEAVLQSGDTDEFQDCEEHQPGSTFEYYTERVGATKAKVLARIHKSMFASIPENVVSDDPLEETLALARSVSPPTNTEQTEIQPEPITPSIANEIRKSVFDELKKDEGRWGPPVDVKSHPVEPTVEEDIAKLEVERRGWAEFGSLFVQTVFGWVKNVCTGFAGMVSTTWSTFVRTAGSKAVDIITEYFHYPSLGSRTRYYAFMAGLTLLLAAVAKLAWTMVRGTISWLIDMFEALKEFFFPRSEQESNIKETNRPRAPGISLVRSPTLQAGDDAIPEIHKIILGNCYLMSYKVGDSWKTIGTIQFIEANMAAMPDHFHTDIGRLSGDTTLCFTNTSSDAFKFELPVSTFLGFERVSYLEQKIDISFVKFDIATLKAHRKIGHFFFTEERVRSFFRSGTEAVKLCCFRDQATKSTPRPFRVEQLSQHCKFVQTMHVEGKEYVQSIEITATTQRGDCGAPLLVACPKYNGPSVYLGMHHAGKRGIMKDLGFSHIITQEMVTEALKQLKIYKDDIIADAKRKGIKITIPTTQEEEILHEAGIVGGSMLVLGKVDRPAITATRSKIKVTPMGVDMPLGPSGKLPSKQAPFYKDGKMVYPMANAMKAFQSPLEFRQPDGLKIAAETVMHPFFAASKDLPRTILTFEEAVVPPAGWRLKPIPRDTSPGYPYNIDHKVGKTEFFGKVGDYEFTSPACQKLRKDAKHIEDRAKENERTCVIAGDFLKDEPRPEAKVHDGLTRAISSVALDYSVVVRQYFGAFLNAFLTVNLDGNFAPGMNPITDWGIMIDNLRSKGENYFAGDFKRFDASEQPFIHMVILEMIEAWYAKTGPVSEEDKRVRSILWLDLIHSRHLTGLSNTQAYVVQWHKSLPSGHPLTTVVNSMYCAIALALCYVRLTGDVSDMHKHVVLIPFGDDNVVSVSDTMRDVFNQRTVAGEMERTLGLTYTSDKKDKELVEFEPIEDITFLQRFTRFEPGVGVLAPLLDGSMLFPAYWHKNNRGLKEDMIDNVQNTLGELSLHSPEKWEEVTGKLFPWLIEHDMLSDVKLTTYDACREWRLNTVDSWI